MAMQDRLNAGQSLPRGQVLTSPSSAARLINQPDGNVVLYHSSKGNHPLWATKTVGSRNGDFVMQGDGNLVLLNSGTRKPLWALNLKNKVAGSVLVLQDDGNLVIYGPRRQVIWATGSQGFQDVRSQGDFLANAAKTCGRPFGAAIAFVDATTGKIDKTITKIPFVGPALHAVLSIATEEYQVANAILKGEQLDRVAMDAIHREISDYKAVAPYVETVITFIPGVGPEISSGIAVGLDLASGQPISDALIDGAAAAIPGGELAKMAFEMGKTSIEAAEKHEKIGQALLETGVAALGAVAEIPAQARAAIVAGVSMIKDVATGVPVQTAALKEGVKLAGAELKSGVSSIAGDRFGAERPQDYQVADALINRGLKLTKLTAAQQATVKNAMKVSIALSHGKASQAKIAGQLKAPSSSTKLSAVGLQVERADPTVSVTGKVAASAAPGVTTPGRNGYLLGMGLVQHKCGIFDIGTLRSTLQGPDLKGFDMALSLHTGRSLARPSHYKQLDPRAQIGFLVTKGMMLAPPDNKAALMKTVASAPQARDGAVAAVKQVAHLRDSWFARLLHKLGF